ncbi:hypothetical protein F5884DRAFT_825415 [Xylogone sp. PMI_703]|nr:hypothetical protein F5884DRAFT_825415 [Xylogone sp. PMI_703]
MRFSLTLLVAVSRQAAAAADWRVSEAAHSSSRSCFHRLLLTPVGALSTTLLAPSIPHLPPGPDAISYPRDGKLHGAEPAPYTPSGGLGTNGSEPVYALALYQEYIELDLFHFAVNRFSTEEFEAAGINADEQFLIKYMGDQEIGHAELIANMLGPAAPQPCTYRYPFTTVRGFIDYSQKNTRYSKSGTLRFLAHLNSRPAADLISQTITSWQWTLLALDIVSCPANQTRLVWQNFPTLNILNNPDKEFKFSWDLPGKPIGPDLSYVTNTTAVPPSFVAWVSQLNVTYTPLSNINGTTGTTIQP